MPGIDHVFDDQHMTLDDGGVEILEQPHSGPAPGARVGRELEEVDLMRDRQRAGEIGEEDDARLEGRDKERIPPLVRGRELFAELADAAGDLLAGEVDLARIRRPGILPRRQEASLSR